MTKKDQIQLDIIIGANQARAEMIQLEADIKKLNSDLKKLPEGSDEAKNALDQLAAKKARMEELRNDIGLTGMTMKELKNRARELQFQIANLDPRTDKWKESRAELTKVNERISELSGKATQTSFSFGKLADGFNKYMGILAAGVAIITGVAMSFTSTIKGNAELSDSYADIQKTTGMTADEVQHLDKSFKSLDTRTKAADLRQIAVVAGQLGIAKEDVFGFSSAVDKLAVSLGDEFQGGAEEVATKMGTLRNVFQDMQTKDVGEDMLKIGNAINVLGAAGFATGPVMTDLSNRIGGVGINLGLSSGQVLGMSATLQELNVSAERGGTAVSQILMKMTSNTQTFAKIAGMDITSFKNLLNKDLYGAFIKVVEGSQKMGAKATDLAAIMDSLKIDGAGASEVFSKLGKNTDLLKQRVDLATVSLTKTDSVMQEFDLKNNNLAAKLEKIGKAFTAAFVNPAVTHWLESVVNLVYKWMGLQVSDKLEKERTEVNGLTIQLMSHNIPASERNRLYDELKQKAPQVLANINKEAINYKQLTANLNAYNNEMINKIILQKKDEEIQDIMSKAANQREKRMAAESSLAQDLRKSQEYIASINKQYGQYLDTIINNTSLSLQEKGQKFRKFIKDENLINQWALVDKTKFENIQADIEHIASFSKDENKITDQLSKITLERQQLADKLKTNLNKTDDNFEKIGDDIGTKTLAQLRSKLDNYNKALETATIGSEAYIRLQGKIKDVNKQINDQSGGGTDFKSGSSDKEARKAEKALEDAYTKEKNIASDKSKALLASEKQYYTESLQGKNDYQDRVKNLSLKYNISDLSNKEAYQLQLIDTEISGYENELAVAEKYGKEISDINEKIEQKKQEREEKLFSILDSNRKEAYRKEENDLKQKHETEELTDDQFNRSMINAKKKYLALEIAAYKKAGKDTSDFEQQNFDNNLALMKLDLDEKKKVLSHQFSFDESRIKAMSRFADRSLATINYQYKAEKNLLDKKLKEHYLTQKEYDDAVRDLDAKTYDSKMAVVMNYAEQAGGLLGSFITGQKSDTKQFLKTMIDTALDALEAQVLISQAAAAAQSYAQTDSVVTFGASGTARTLILTGLIHAAFAAAKAGINSAFYTGGYTGDGHPLEPAGIVHKGEYVVPTFLMSNPSVLKQVQVFETIRRQKLGYAAGGYVSNNNASSAGTDTSFTEANMAMMIALSQSLNNLNSTLANGIDAKMSYDHLTKELAKMNKITTLASKR
jgi:TP901 family phage tail tape measure protein